MMLSTVETHLFTVVKPQSCIRGVKYLLKLLLMTKILTVLLHFRDTRVLMTTHILLKKRKAVKFYFFGQHGRCHVKEIFHTFTAFLSKTNS